MGKRIFASYEKMKDKFTKSGISYTISGQDRKKCIVLIHGVWGSSSALNRYERYLSKKYKVINFDLRGHGKSIRPKYYEEYSLDKFATDMLHILKKEKITKVILIGNSFGNFVALEFIRKYPKMVEKLILISPHYNLRKIPLTKFTRSFLNFLVIFYRIFPNTKKRERRDYSRYIGKHNKDWDLGRVLPDMYNTGAKSSLVSLAKVYNYSAEEFIEKIEHPTFIIHGEKDSVFPIKYAQEMAYRIRKSKFITVSNANHTMILNNFNELKIILNKVLKN